MNIKFFTYLKGAEKITFRAIQEDGGGNKILTSFTKNPDELIKKYNKTCGIFFTVNHTGNENNLDRDVKQVNAAFIDIDDGPLPPFFPLEPSAIVSRDDGQGHHVYWLLHPSQDIETWKTAQKVLIAFYKSDAAIKNPGRLMRVPGTINRKPKRGGQAYQIKELKKIHYDLNDIITAHTDKKAVLTNLRGRFDKAAATIKKGDKGAAHSLYIKIVMLLHGHAFSDEDIYKELDRINQKFFDGSYTERTLREKITAKQYAKNKKGEELKESIEKELARQERVRDAVKNWVFVQQGGYFVNLHDPQIERTIQGFNAHFSNLSDINDPAKYVFRHDLICQAERVIYEPGAGRVVENQPFFPLVNLYNDDRVPPDDSPYQWFLDHIDFLIPAGDREHLLDWMAYTVQNPGKKIHHAILIIGGFGIGKSILYNLFKNLYGPTNISQPANETLADKYTKWAKHCSFCMINELKQEDNTGFYDALKSFITEDEIEIREMYRNAYTIKNYMNILAFSNEEVPIKLKHSDRRWYVIRSEAKQRDPKYYKDFIKNCEQNSGGVVQFLTDRDISQFEPGRMPGETEAKRYIIQDSMPDFKHWLLEAVENKKDVLQYDIVCIRDIITAASDDNYSSRVPPSKTIMRYLREMGAVSTEKAVRARGRVEKYVIIRNIDTHRPMIESPALGKYIDELYGDDITADFIEFN